ncbi:MAG: hypothetical protein ABIW32_02780 [Terrimesophilobacter sp.]
MGQLLDQSVFAENLVGEWRIGASNIEDWVNGTRRDALFHFTKEQDNPLVLSEVQVFTTREGKARRIELTSRLVDREFISKGRRIVGTMSRWFIGAVDSDHGIVVVRITHARGAQDGLIVLLRQNAPLSELRSTIANNSDGFGVGPEDFASLSWVPVD